MKAAHVPTNHSAGGTFHYAKDGNTLLKHEPPTALNEQQIAARAKRAPVAATKAAPKKAAKKGASKKSTASKAAPKTEAPAAAAPSQE
jgi:hypothetical protein